jgi:subtilase family serine protease
VAPKANIILYEAANPDSDGLGHLETAVSTAKNNAAVSVVSMSYGSGEYSGEKSNDSLYTTPSARLVAHSGVTFVASTGDSGAPGEYPAYSPNIVAVGGTSLTLNSNNSYATESAWSGGGGGISTQEPKPSYQTGLAALAGINYRATPDISMDSDPDTGVDVWDPYNGGMYQMGGTSLAAPCVAGLLAIADQLRVAAGKGTLDGPSQTLPTLYSLPGADFNDVTTGSNGYPAGVGYDEATGLGTPVANLLVPALAQLSTVPEPSTFALLGSGAVALVVVSSRRRTAVAA